MPGNDPLNRNKSHPVFYLLRVLFLPHFWGPGSHLGINPSNPTTSGCLGGDFAVLVPQGIFVLSPTGRWKQPPRKSPPSLVVRNCLRLRVLSWLWPCVLERGSNKFASSDAPICETTCREQPSVKYYVQ